ncbi:SLOG family protein [Streptomyces adonidis]|uniref:SLOG family protein n=1 Tax=Streptomyces adonidis TaxID=3231367 RepID=UPI0034DB5EAD
MAMEMGEPRVLVCGSRRWPWPQVVEAVLDRLVDRYGQDLVIIEGAATGADRAAHDWCERHGLGEERHRCYPVDWAAEKRVRPDRWRMAGPERNTRMLLSERPRLVVAFHERFAPGSGGTSDMALRAVLREVPVWLIPSRNVQVGTWVRPGIFPPDRARRVAAELHAAEGRQNR